MPMEIYIWIAPTQHQLALNAVGHQTDIELGQRVRQVPKS